LKSVVLLATSRYGNAYFLVSVMLITLTTPDSSR
jgi:hypothetical protein